MKGYNVGQLRAELRERKLDHSGRRKDLVARLEQDNARSREQERLLNVPEMQYFWEEFDGYRPVGKLLSCSFQKKMFH